MGSRCVLSRCLVSKRNSRKESKSASLQGAKLLHRVLDVNFCNAAGGYIPVATFVLFSTTLIPSGTLLIIRCKCVRYVSRDPLLFELLEMNSKRSAALNISEKTGDFTSEFASQPHGDGFTLPPLA